MEILQSIFKSRDKPQNATSGSAYRFFIGGSSSGKNVNESSAMQMTAVYSCVRILSEAVASLPLHVYKYNGDGGKEKAVKHPLYFLLHDEPNPEMTSFVFRETLMTHLLLWGNAYAQIIRNGKGEIIALYPLMPNRMTVDSDDKGQLYYQYNTSKDDAPTMKGSMVNLKPSDVLHIPGLGFDGLVGYSPIAMAKNAIGMAIACEEYPILIYGLFGIPQMGVRGAAWATVIGQCVSLFIAVLFHFKVNREIKNGWSYMKPSAAVVKGIYAIGLPAVIAQELMSLMTYLLNIIFVQVGENVVTAYGLYYKIQQFLLFAAFGLRDAITPIISFNHGKGSRIRVQEGIKFGMMYTLAIMLAGFIVLEIIAVPLAGVFGLTGETAGLCVAAIRIISFCYMFAGANIAFQGIFQALDSGIESLILSVCRQFLFVIPVAWGLSKLVLNRVLSTELIWISFPVAEGLTVLVAMIFMRRIYCRKIQA